MARDNMESQKKFEEDLNRALALSLETYEFEKLQKSSNCYDLCISSSTVKQKSFK